MERLAAKAEAQKAKLEALERKLGIDPASSSTPGEVSSEVSSGKKHRFDDTEYLEKTEELKEGVKNAVSVALLKKRKKAKLTSTSESAAKPQDSSTETKTTTVSEKEIVKPATQSITLDSVGA